MRVSVSSRGEDQIDVYLAREPEDQKRRVDRS
jgi:hypothetical protein